MFGPSATEIQEIARQTLASFEHRHQLLSFFQRRRNELFDAVADFRAIVRTIDPEQFTEDNFVSVDHSLARVIDFLEKHLATGVDSRDTAQCMFIGDSIRELRDARYWVVQGYSPDPSKRPSEEEQRRLAEEHAASSLQNLFA